jgi:hypothetical protein
VQHLDYPLVCARTEQLGWQGRVAFGHGSKFSCLPVTEQTAIGQRLGASGVSLAVLPATDLFNGLQPLKISTLNFCNSTVRGTPVMNKQGRIEGASNAFGIGKQMFPFLPAMGVVQPICPIHQRECEGLIATCAMVVFDSAGKLHGSAFFWRVTNLMPI